MEGEGGRLTYPRERIHRPGRNILQYWDPYVMTESCYALEEWHIVVWYMGELEI